MYKDLLPLFCEGIKQWFSNERRDEAVENGKELIAKAMRKHNLPYISVVQAGGQITEEILAWAQQHGTQRQPVVIAATQQVFGSPEFQAAYQAESAVWLNLAVVQWTERLSPKE